MKLPAGRNDDITKWVGFNFFSFLFCFLRTVCRDYTQSFSELLVHKAGTPVGESQEAYFYCFALFFLVKVRT